MRGCGHLGGDSVAIAQLHRFRNKRNIGGYARAGAVSAEEVEEMITFARTLRREVERWLRANHPELL